MELHQLRAFTRIVEAGSFHAAAAELHVTQAAVSHSIKALESRAGATLLVRGPKGVSLTEAGKVLLPYAKRIVETVDAASEDLASLQEGGALKLATFASASSHYLPAVMKAFHTRFPRIHLDIKEGNDLEALQWLRAGEADIAFVVDGPNDVEFQPLYDDDFVLVARRTEFPQDFRSPIPIEALAGQQVVSSMGGCARVVSAAMSASNVSVSYPAAARETSTALALVQAGVGVAILPRLLVPEPPSPLVCFDIVPRITRQIGIAVRKSERRAHAAASFLSLVAHMRVSGQPRSL